MKNIKFLSILALLTANQLYSSANPSLYFALAAQTSNALSESIILETQDKTAQSLIAAMNNYIQFDKDVEAQMPGLFDYITGSTADIASLKASADKNKSDYERFKSSIKKMEKSGGGITAGEKKNVNRRRNDRDDAKKDLEKDLAAIERKTASMKSKQDKINELTALQKQNILSFEQALDDYITEFGMFSAQPGTLFGETIIISSNYDQNAPITPKQYNNLLETLDNAIKQFETIDSEDGRVTSENIMVTLDNSFDGAEKAVNLVNIVKGINKISLGDGFVISNYLPSNYVLAGLVGAAAITGLALAGYNYSQGLDLLDSQVINEFFNFIQTNTAAFSNYLNTNASLAANYVATNEFTEQVTTWATDAFNNGNLTLEAYLQAFSGYGADALAYGSSIALEIQNAGAQVIVSQFGM